MAGRGRQSTLPAWMTAEGGAGVDLGGISQQISTNPPEQGQFEDKIESKSRSNGHSGGDRPPSSRDERPRKSRSRDRGHRSQRSTRSRSRDRGSNREEKPREKDRGENRGGEMSRGGESRTGREKRSVSADRGKVWVSRKLTRISNFDVRPPDGIELPGVGLGGLSTGVGLGGMVPVGGDPHAMNRPSGGMIAGIYGNAMVGMGDAARQQQTRHARRLYVGGIPPGTVDEELNSYFNNVIARATAPHVMEGGPPVVQIYINPEKCFAFVELTSIELTTACLALDGMKYDHRAGTSIIRVRRPNDFKPDQMPSNLQPLKNFNLNVFGMQSPAVDGVGKLFIGGLPYHLEDEQVKELLSAFGTLKSFHLVRDPGSVTSKGYGFCEYLDLMTTQNAISGLNDLKIGDKTLTVRIATSSTGAAPSQIMTHMQSANIPGLGGIFQGGAPPQQGYGGMGMAPMAPTIATMQPTRILKMTNMVTAAELNDDAEFFDIRDDVTTECAEYGRVLSVVIPRGRDGFSPSSEGLIFVEFQEASMARTCAIALSGRKFDSRVVIVDYYDENRFADRFYG